MLSEKSLQPFFRLWHTTRKSLWQVSSILCRFMFSHLCEWCANTKWICVLKANPSTVNMESGVVLCHIILEKPDLTELDFSGLCHSHYISLWRRFGQNTCRQTWTWEAQKKHRVLFTFLETQLKDFTTGILPIGYPSHTYVLKPTSPAGSVWLHLTYSWLHLLYLLHWYL